MRNREVEKSLKNMNILENQMMNFEWFKEKGNEWEWGSSIKKQNNTDFSMKENSGYVKKKPYLDILLGNEFLFASIPAKKSFIGNLQVEYGRLYQLHRLWSL